MNLCSRRVLLLRMCPLTSINTPVSCIGRPLVPQVTNLKLNIHSTDGDFTECLELYWTDIEVSAFDCDVEHTTLSLSFSHPEMTETTTSLDKTGSSNLSKTQTGTVAAAAATSSSSSKRKYFTAGETAGMVIGLVVGVAFLTGAFFQFFRKRREAAAAGEAHTAAIVQRHSKIDLAGAAAATDTKPPDQNGVNASPQTKFIAQGDDQAAQAPDEARRPQAQGRHFGVRRKKR